MIILDEILNYYICALNVVSLNLILLIYVEIITKQLKFQIISTIVLIKFMKVLKFFIL